jgi:hypothetical protein
MHNPSSVNESRLYQEDDAKTKNKTTIGINFSAQATRMDLNEMIQILAKAGYVIQKTSIRQNSFDTGG